MSAVVATVFDGDTLTLTNGKRVRFLQIDAPELGSGECYSRASRTALLQRVPIGSRVVLEADRRLDNVDRYGRLLRYVRRGTMNVNLALVRAGAAAPYFFRGERGRYAARLLKEANRAKTKGAGSGEPVRERCSIPPARSRRAGAGGRVRDKGGGGGRCDRQSYPTVCIPRYPPDLDCADVRSTDFRVRPPDPHGFDGDNDGVGCES